MKNVVVMGGGTGTFTVLNGIKNLKDINITAIVSSADSGGSTGVLRDQFGQLPVGDFRQCLVALAEESHGRNILRELFQYRFSKGGAGLVGHNMGNLLITALSDIIGNEEEAFREASKILNVKGRVFPVTFDKVQLVAEYEDGTIAFGESMIDEPLEDYVPQRINRLWTQPKGEVFYRTKEALENADYLVLGPGDLYTSIIANLVVDSCAEIIAKSKVKIIYISNLMSKYSETDKFKLSDYINELEMYLGCGINHIIANNTKINLKTKKKYEFENSHPVEFDMNGDKRVIRGDYTDEHETEPIEGDNVRRSLLRHDSDKLSEVISSIITKD